MNVIDKSSEITGGEAIARMLQALGAGPMFGMGGFQLLPFYDAARRLGLEHNLINDERCAVFIADAYAKVSGRVGVCDATLGPGATNLLTGLVEALNAGSALVVLVGDSHRGHAGKNMTQETHQIQILRPACKELIRIEAIERIPELVRRAFAVATCGRPGPVILDIPEDISHATYPFAASDLSGDETASLVPARRCRPARSALERAAAMLAGAERPIMLCGGGVHISGAAEQLQAFATEHGIPVAHTLTGKGAIACCSPLSVGLFGRYDRIANQLIDESDCIFVIGCKLGEIATKRYMIPAPGRRIIHLDILPEEFERTTAVELALWGDARETIEELATLMRGSAKPRSGYLEDVARRKQAWRASVEERLASGEQPINMARLLNEINKTLPDDGLLVADGGFAAHWGGLLFDTKKPGRSFVPDRGFASIGYGVPGAIGAALARPGSRVVALTGDGGFNMSMGELETALRLKLAVTIVIVNNAASGYVKALQHLLFGQGSYQSSDLIEMNYAKIAESMGCQGIRVEDPGKIAAAFAAAFAEKGRPTVLDVVVTRDPGKMLPGVDNRAVKVRKGDRVA